MTLRLKIVKVKYAFGKRSCMQTYRLCQTRAELPRIVMTSAKTQGAESPLLKGMHSHLVLDQTGVGYHKMA
jgi:hypothetical protein